MVKKPGVKMVKQFISPDLQYYDIKEDKDIGITLTVSFVCILVVPINLTVRFNNMKWNRNLSDPESDNFKNLSRTIQQNVRFVTLLLP